MKSILTVKKLKGVRVLLRIDANVTLVKNKINEEETFRFNAVLPTLTHLISHGARVIIISHIGRPDGHFDSAFSLRPIARFFEKKLQKTIHFFSTVNDVKKYVIKDGECVMLENLRFNIGETKNSKIFAKELASLADIYVNDAFPVCHRKNASIVAITKFLPSYAGISLLKEIKMLTHVIKKMSNPLVVILGGIKSETRVPLLDRFAPFANAILLGAKIGNELQRLKSKKYFSIVYPIDMKINKGEIYDIGPLTIKHYATYIEKAKMIIWNGTMGFIENKKYVKGTEEIAKLVARSKAFSVVGGGETVKVILKLNLQNNISFVSTGGGAMLVFLAGERMPGIDALSQAYVKN